MNQEIKQKWIEALLSNKYKQGTEALKKGDRYCCLGVLCDVLGAKWNEYDHSQFSSPPHNQYLNDGALTLAGLSHDQQFELALLNDRGASFKDIADRIERTL